MVLANDGGRLRQICQTLPQLSNLRERATRTAYTLYSLASPWPFSTGGIDVIGKIHPQGAGGHCFVLVAMDYFTKWVEAKSYRILGAKEVAKFIQTNIICQYGIPREFISDQGTHFRGETAAVLEKYHIKHHKSSPY